RFGTTEQRPLPVLLKLSPHTGNPLEGQLVEHGIVVFGHIGHRNSPNGAWASPRNTGAEGGQPGVSTAAGESKQRRCCSIRFPVPGRSWPGNSHHSRDYGAMEEEPSRKICRLD